MNVGLKPLTIGVASLFTFAQPVNANTLFAGPSALINDPFVGLYGLNATVSLHHAPHFGSMVGGSIYFNHGEASWKPLTRQLVEKNKVSPDISTLKVHGFGAIFVEPLQSTQGDLSTSIGAYAGIGFAATQDDLDALGDDSVEAQTTAKQTHPAGVFGIYTDLLVTPSAQFRMKAHTVTFVETIASKTLEKKNQIYLSVEYGLSFGQRGSR